jgi:4-amino-4-deoxy-L-arabinose transferase-like glycosyltransferase
MVAIQKARPLGAIPDRGGSPHRKRGRRALLAIAGICWAWWWDVTASPSHAFALWAAAVLLAAGAFYERVRIGRGTSLTITVSVVGAFLVVARLVDLSTVPYFIETDEVLHPLFGLEILRGEPWELFGGVSHYYRTPYLTHVLQAVPSLLLSPLLGARLASTLLSVGSLASTYALAGRLFGRSVAGVATVLMGVSYWHVLYSRTAYPYMQAILVVPLALYLLTRGVAERHRFLQFCGGILLGLSLLVYTSARIVIPVFAVWFAYRLILAPRHWREAAKAVAVVGIGAALISSPYLRAHGVTGILFDRYQETALNPHAPVARLNTLGWTSPRGAQLLLTQGRAAARAYYEPGAWLAVHSPSPRGLLDPVSLALAVIGMGVVAVRIRQPRYLLLAVWIAATFTFGQVLTDVPHAAYRAAPALPALAICGGIAVVWLAGLLPGVLRSASTSVRAMALVALAVALSPLNASALRAYLERRTADPVGSVARFIAAGPRNTTYYVVWPGPFFLHHVPRFVAAGHILRDVPSLVETLEHDLNPEQAATFVVHFEMRGAAAVIRSCYPGATVVADTAGAGPNSILALHLSPAAQAAGRQCNMGSASTGLLARYYSGADWNGPIALERVEAWPVRWGRPGEHAPFRSVEWSGLLRVPVAGEYQFQLVNLNDAVGTATIADSLTLDATRPSSPLKK